MLLAMLLWACGASDDVATPPPHVLDDSWVATISSDPAVFTRVVDADREGWIALHGNQLDAASAHPGPAAVAAAIRLASAQRDLAQLSARAWEDTLSAWESRSKLPEGSALSLFAALAARERGDAAAEARWLERAAKATDARVREAAEILASTPAGQPASKSGNPLIDRYNAHLAARATGEVVELRKAAAGPLWREPLEPGERLLFDPMIHLTLSAALMPKDPIPAGMEGLLFSPCLTEGHLSAERDSKAAYGERCMELGLAALAISPPAGPQDDPEAARSFVHALDASLDPWLKTRLALLPPEGADILGGLDLVRRLRADWLVALARQSLAADRPHQALELLRLALDAENGRALSPVNGPSLYALTAEANLRTGRVREALDALEVLTTAWPEVTGVDELIGDLSILKSLDRMGDSKEN